MPRTQRAFVFLETSLQIQRRVGNDLVKRAVKAAIAGQTCVSSFYVFMEYKRVLVKTLVEFWGVLQEEDTVADALYHFSQHMQPRKPKLILSILGQLLDEDDLKNDKTQVLRNVEMLIEASIVYFERDIDHFIDDRQGCPLARASTAKGYERFLREISCETKCKVERFWASEKDSLRRLHQEGTMPAHKTNIGFAKIYENIGEALNDPASQKTKSKCAKCGDVIIALEVPVKDTLLTFDRSFESLCGILNKPVNRLRSLAELKREEAR